MFYVYYFLNTNKDIIYIGRTNNIDKRMKSHFLYGGHLDVRAYAETKAVIYMQLPTLIDSKLKEIYYINMHKPKYNTQDKQKEMVYSHVDCSTDRFFYYDLASLLNQKTPDDKFKKIMLENFLSAMSNKYLDSYMKKKLIDIIDCRIKGKKQTQIDKLNKYIKPLGYQIVVKNFQYSGKTNKIWVVVKI